MNWTDRAGVAIGVAALATSARTAYLFVAANDGDLMHQWATPFCLEALALVALAKGKRWMFWPPFIVAVAINVAQPWPNHVLSAIHALPPLAAVMVGHALLTRPGLSTGVDGYVDKPSADLDVRDTDAEVERTYSPDTPVKAETNGTKVHTAKVTIADLRRMFADTAAIHAWYRESDADTWEAAWESIGATINQGNQLRREYKKAGK